MSHPIKLSRKGSLVTLTLDRPESLNSLSLEAIQLLLSHLRALSVDTSVRALVITGSGRGFCAGWQLDSNGVPGLPDESLGVRQAHLMAEYFNPVIQALHDLPFPSIAAVNGVCAGAGVSLALACDLMLIAESASFVLTFAPKLGLIPDLGATWKIAHLLGWGRAQAITMLGDRIAAADAVQWGLAWRSYPDAGLPEAVEALALRLAASPPGVCREVRYAYHAAYTNGLAAQLEYERLRQRELLDAPAFAVGLAAFQEKRTPDFYQVPA